MDKKSDDNSSTDDNSDDQSVPLLAVWDVNLTDHPFPMPDIAGFLATIRHFIEVYLVAEDAD